MASREGAVGLDFFLRGKGAATSDARVLADSTGKGADGSTPHYRQRKYETATVELPLATGVEARVLQAEGYFFSGDVAAWRATMNALWASQGLPVYPIPDGTFAERARFYIREQSFFMWQSGRRLGDARRLVRHYNFPMDDVFPRGGYHMGGTYGTDVSLPIPASEMSNPNLQLKDGSLCLSRSP